MKHDGLGVVEYCLRHGYCSRLDPTPAAWYELHVKCTRLFSESYQQLQPAFDVPLVICEQMHKPNEKKTVFDQTQSKLDGTGAMGGGMRVVK